MVALSDAVFAIAMTLLVLELAVGESGTAMERLLDGWPTYLAYALSFFTLGGAWLFHNALTERLEAGDAALLRLNLLVLLFVGFLPFPTRLISASVHDLDAQHVFVTLYGLTLLGIAVTLYMLDSHARRKGFLSSGTRTQGEALTGVVEERAERRVLITAMGAYAATVAVGLFLPRVALICYWVIAIYLVVPIRHLVGLVFRRS